MSIDTEKYKFLFEYQKSLYEEEITRFKRLEEKAMKYLSAITFALGGYIFLIRSTIDKILPPHNTLEYLIILSIIVTFICFISAWSLVFRTIQLSNIVKMPSNNDIIEYFKDNTKETVYLGLSRKYSEAIIEIEKYYAIKVAFAKKAYTDITGTVWLLSISVILIFIKQWSN